MSLTATYRTSPDPRSPRSGWRVIEPAPLGEFVILSMLLHAIAILLFGAPSGGSPHGRAIWGSLDVVIREILPEPPPALKIDRALRDSYRVPATRARPAPTPPSAPIAPLRPAQELSTPAVTEPPPVALPTPPVAQPVPPPAPPAPPPEAPPVPQRTEPAKVEAPVIVPPLMERYVAPERREILTPPEPIALPVAPTPPPEAPPVAVPVVPAPPAPPPTPAPIVQPPAPTPLERPSPPRVERAPAETPAVTAPLVEPKLPPPVERVTPPVEAKPVEAPPVPIPPPVVTAPAVTPPVVTKPVEAPPVPVPAPAPTPERVAPVERAPVTAPPEIREAPTRTAPPTTTAPPAATPPDRPETRSPSRDATPSIQPPAPSVPFNPRDRAGVSPPPRDAPGSDYDPFSSKSGLDRDSALRRAREIAREGSGNRAILPFPMPPPAERKTKEQIAIENARKPDCNTAYSGLGLLAVIPLVANEFGEGTCRWR